MSYILILISQTVESFLRYFRYFRAFLYHKLPGLRNWLYLNSLVIGTFLRIPETRQFCPVSRGGYIEVGGEGRPAGSPLQVLTPYSTTVLFPGGRAPGLSCSVVVLKAFLVRRYFFIFL